MTKYDLEELFFYHSIAYSSKIKTSKGQEIKSLPKFDNKDKMEFLFVHSEISEDRSLSKRIFDIIDLAIEYNSFILISSFYFSNFEIINALIKASKQLKGKIYILVGDEFALTDSVSKSGELISIGLIDLAKNGAQIRKKNGAHLKFIVSGESCMMMSANLSTEGLFSNPEYGIFLEKDNPIYNSLKIVFSILWHQKSEMLLSEKGWIKAPNWMALTDYSPKITSNKTKLILSSNSIISTINSKNEIISSNNLLTVILSLLKKANKSIDISIFSIHENSGNQLSELFRILEDKSSQIDVRILVPQIKLRSTKAKSMLETLNKLLDKNADIRYYKELHGKIIIIDNNEALFLTGNIDEHLEDDDSYDIGYHIKSTPLINNIAKIYDHLWEEASELIEPNINLKLKINLIIESQDYLSSSHNISIFDLETKIKFCSMIKLYYSKTKSLIEIVDKDNGNYSFQILHTEDKVIEREFIFIKGVINQSMKKFNKRNTEEFVINEIQLNLYWIDLV